MTPTDTQTAHPPECICTPIGPFDGYAGVVEHTSGPPPIWINAACPVHGATDTQGDRPKEDGFSITHSEPNTELSGNPGELNPHPIRGEGEPYTADHLQTLLNGRDEFIVRKGLWSEFVDSLPAHPPTSYEGEPTRKLVFTLDRLDTADMTVKPHVVEIVVSVVRGRKGLDRL